MLALSLSLSLYVYKHISIYLHIYIYLYIYIYLASTFTFAIVFFTRLALFLFFGTRFAFLPLLLSFRTTTTIALPPLSLPPPVQSVPRAYSGSSSGSSSGNGSSILRSARILTLVSCCLRFAVTLLTLFFACGTRTRKQEGERRREIRLINRARGRLRASSFLLLFPRLRCRLLLLLLPLLLSRVGLRTGRLRIRVSSLLFLATHASSTAARFEKLRRSWSDRRHHRTFCRLPSGHSALPFPISQLLL